MSTVADCPDESTCPRVRHEWTPEPTVIHKPRVCLRGERVNPRAWNPESWAKRITALATRGLDRQLAEELWRNGNDALVSEIEAATDAQVAELNAAYAAKERSGRR